MSFVDLHVHFLPGVDDGPATFDETVAMLRLAHRGGTRVVVATPHLYSPAFDGVDPDRLRSLFMETERRLHALGQVPDTSFLAEMSFYPGAEHHLSPEFLSALDSGAVMPIGASRYLLIEFPHGLPASAMASASRRILDAGLIPLLAHVERYEAFRLRPQELRSLVALGCVAQVNGGSLMVSRGRGRRRFCRLLLERGLAEVVASDGHDAGRRPPVLDAAAGTLRRSFPEAAVTSWLEGNPSRILEGRPLSRPGPASSGY